MTALVECEHVPSDNPRYNKSCLKCGRLLPEPLWRNLELEREITQEAAKGAVDPDPLIAHAESRAHGLSAEYVADPLHIRPGRDRIRDIREELADARNHAVFHLQEHVEDERNPEVLIALRFIALAYDRLREPD